MLSEKDLQNLISESDKVQIPEVVENNIDTTYRSIRKRSSRKRQTRTAIKSSLLTILIINIVVFISLFSTSNVNAKSYILDGGQLYEESNLKSQSSKRSFFNKPNNLDIQVTKILQEANDIYVEYVLVGNFNNVNDVTRVKEMERNIKVIGANLTSNEFNNFKKINDNVIIFSETIKIDKVNKDSKALIIKQNINNVDGIQGNWEVTLKIMKQKVKEEKVKNNKLK